MVSALSAGSFLLGLPGLAEVTGADSSSKPALSADSKSVTEQEVDQLFSQALKLLRENRAYEAREVLEKAAALEPDSAGIHCNLGLAFQNSGNIERAIAEFSQALRLKPAMAEPTLNIAGCYQSLGETDKAIGWYEKYLQQNPSSAEAGQVRDIIQALNSYRNRPGSDPRLPDYFESISLDGTYRWPADKLPIKVFVDSGAAVDGFRESFPRLLTESFDAWVQASGHRIEYILVENRSQADVICTWTSSPLEVGESGTQSERGMAHVYSKAGEITRGTVKILTRPMLEQGALSDDDMKKACLHEIGHVLGLQGHSTNNHDVMFFTVDTATVWPVLSKRDKATMAKLYKAYPEISGSASMAPPGH